MRQSVNVNTIALREPDDIDLPIQQQTQFKRQKVLCHYCLQVPRCRWVPIKNNMTTTKVK